MIMLQQMLLLLKTPLRLIYFVLNHTHISSEINAAYVSVSLQRLDFHFESVLHSECRYSAGDAEEYHIKS